MNERRERLAGSQPRHLERATPSLLGAAPASAEPIEVTIVLRRRCAAAEWRAKLEAATVASLRARRYLSHQEFAELWSARQEDVDAVDEFAASSGLQTLEASAARRCVMVRGSADALTRAFGLEAIETRDHPEVGTFRTPRGSVHLPPDLVGRVEFVLGLDDLEVNQRHWVARPSSCQLGQIHDTLATYEFPERLDGAGQSIALIELGGGFYQDDLEAYFRGQSLPVPSVEVIGVHGAANAPAPRAAIGKVWDAMESLDWSPCSGEPRPALSGDPDLDAQVLWTIESTMDVELAGTAAPGAQLVVFRADNTDAGQFHAFAHLLGEAAPNPTVVSCSFGASERRHTPAFMRCLDQCFQAAALLGITVILSTGDWGDGSVCQDPNEAPLLVEFPASSPHVLACGGSSLNPETGREVVWNETLGGAPVASGGGFSRTFQEPSWQTKAGISPQQFVDPTRGGDGRALPDVVAKANFDQAFAMIAGGHEIPMGGTSASVPLWAGLTARLNQGLGLRCGALGPLMSAPAVRCALHEITQGSIGFYQARAGWNPCSGWGSPRGRPLLSALQNLG